MSSDYPVDSTKKIEENASGGGMLLKGRKKLKGLQ